MKIENSFALPTILGVFFLIVGASCFVAPIGTAVENSTNYLQGETIFEMILRLIMWFWINEICGMYFLITGLLLIKNNVFGLYLARVAVFGIAVVIIIYGIYYLEDSIFLKMQTIIVAAIILALGFVLFLLGLIENQLFKRTLK